MEKRGRNSFWKLFAEGLVNQREPVYEEWECELIPSGHGPGIHYRVFLGTVNWTGVAGDEEKAVAVFIQYGSEPVWRRAVTANEIAFHLPAHILSKDIAAVLHAISKFQGR